MANNFRQIGDYYVSKSGNDSNVGTNPDAPFLTPFHNITGNIVIGTGFYNTGINVSSVLTSQAYVGDGSVVINSNNNPANISIYGTTSFNNLTIINFDNLSSNLINIGSPAIVNFTNCTFKNCVFQISATSNRLFSNCTFINCDFTLSSSTNIYFINCIVINSILKSIIQFKNSYCNQATTLYVDNTINDFDYNNINGKINFSFGSYSGTSITLAQQKANYPTYNINSFDLDPQFNNITKSDFSYAINSPNLNKGQGNAINIGNTNYGKGLYSISSNELNPSNGAIINNLVLNGNDYILSSNTTLGTILSTPIAIASYIAEVQKINYLGYLFFDKSFSGGTDNNSNVPDYSTYLSGDTTGGGNPDRLCYRIRWSTKLTIPTVFNDWDNGGLVTVGNYSEFEWGQKPLIDALGRGNGNPAFNKVTAMPIGARWIQIEVTLRNNYNN